LAEKIIVGGGVEGKTFVTGGVSIKRGVG
jgi:hypothetical protein